MAACRYPPATADFAGSFLIIFCVFCTIAEYYATFARLNECRCNRPNGNRSAEHLINFPACGVGVPKCILEGRLAFQRTCRSVSREYTRFHYVYAGLHGLPADLVLRATSQAVSGPRLGHAGCVTSRTNCVSTACCGCSGTTPRPDLAGAFPARFTTKPPGKNARRRRCGFCWAV